MISYGKHSLDADDIEAVKTVLSSEYLTQGPVVPEFESEIAKKVGVPYCVATNSATSALQIACLALGVMPGDIVWTSTISFVASANCASLCGAKVEFLDIDIDTFNLSIPLLELKLQEAERLGSVPKVVIVVHFGGLLCDMEKLSMLAKKYDFRIIEDASHALGSVRAGDFTGSCSRSDITVFSFHPVKSITTGEGGMATTRSEQLMRRMQIYREHGITRVSEEMTRKDMYTGYYEQISVGYNFRMSDIQAALGLSQLTKLEQFILRRGQLAGMYRTDLRQLPIVPQSASPAGEVSAQHLFSVRIDASRTQISRNNIIKKLRDKKIAVGVHYIPIHTQPYYKALNQKTVCLPNAELYFDETLSLPLYPKLSDLECQHVIQTLNEILN